MVSNVVRSQLRCLGCRRLIRDKPRTLMLKITDDEQKLMKLAKELGFTSSTWQKGDFIKAQFDANCFTIATRIWRVAFTTRLVRPRRVEREIS